MTGVRKGRHVWYELLTHDPEGAKAFYGAVVGWSTTPFEGAEPPYDVWTTERGMIGGVMQMPEPAASAGVPPHWLGYVATPDTDATADRVKALGGRVVVPATDIPTVGRFAVVQDPSDAVFTVFTPAEPGPAQDGRAQPGEVSWHELMSADHDEAFAFYADLFGWQKGEAVDMGPAGTYQLVRCAGADRDFGGMMNRPAEMPMSAWLYYFNVADLDGALERVEAEGGQIAHGPMEVPGGDRVCVCTDPQGAAFALHVFAAAE